MYIHTSIHILYILYILYACSTYIFGVYIKILYIYTVHIYTNSFFYQGKNDDLENPSSASDVAKQSTLLLATVIMVLICFFS